MNIKNLIKSLLLIFVVFSFAFLIYKEFSSVNGNDAITKSKTTYAYDKSAGTNEINPINKPGTIAHDQSSFSQTTVKSKNSKVIAYYFYGTFRCTTCRTIEQYSHDTIYTYFSKELENGTLEFRPVNVEEPNNRHFIRDYQLFSRSLVLSLIHDGKEMKWKNLTEVWKFVRDKDKFFQYVKDEVEQFLKET